MQSFRRYNEIRKGGWSVPIQFQCHRCRKASTLPDVYDIQRYECECGATTMVTPSAERPANPAENAEVPPPLLNVPIAVLDESEIVEAPTRNPAQLELIDEPPPSKSVMGAPIA